MDLVRFVSFFFVMLLPLFADPCFFVAVDRVFPSLWIPLLSFVAGKKTETGQRLV